MFIHLFSCGKKCIIFTTLSGEFCGIKYIHMVIQPSSCSISRTFLSSYTENFYLLNNKDPSTWYPVFYFKSVWIELFCEPHIV